MSLRQLRKLEKLKKQQQEEDLAALQEAEGEDAEGEQSEDEVQAEPVKKASVFNQFAGMIDSSDDSENDQTEATSSKPEISSTKSGKKEQNDQSENVPSESKSKKKKKKKKNKKNKQKEQAEEVVDEDKLLEQAIEENKELMKEQGITPQTESSVLRMYEKYFDSDREMKIKLQSRGIGKIEMDGEEVKATGNNYDGLNRKQKKRMQQMEKLNKGKNAFRNTKKLIFVQPDLDWERHDIKHVYMESSRDHNDNKVFDFIEKQIYKEIQSEFRSTQQSYDISMMMHFLSKNYFHHETLIHVSDFLRMQGKFPDAVKLIQRCMYAFEVLFSKDFTILGPKPVTRVKFSSENSNLAKVLADCLVRYIDHLGRKGCVRTALEFTKFFLSLDPENDPFGNLLKIDYYALRSGEFRYLSNFAERYSTEFHSHPLKTCLFAPNLLLSTSIAKFKLKGKNSDVNKICEEQLEKINEFISLIHEYACDESPRILQTLYQFEAEGLLMLGLVFYPTLVKQIMIKVEADKKPNLKRADLEGHQLSAWGKILDHSLFEFNEDDEVLEHSLGLDSDVLNKYFDLYVDRTSECYKDDDVLDWIKQVVGFVLNQVDNDNFDRDVMFQFIFSAVGLPYELKRYSDLSKEFFNDDFTTVNPNELLGGQGVPAGMNMQEMANNVGGGMNQAQMEQQVQAQLEQMVANGQVPPQVADMIRNRGGENANIGAGENVIGDLPEADPDNLILEDPNIAHEQQLIMDQIAQQQQPVDEEDFLILDSGDTEVHKDQDEEEKN